ncbi:uncharacterized protein Fot_26496 [Forsythia ovata]|uniref:RRM domain-containing protein n=1 Tax=Forsythia ovata TaxID=205694 RepID=A0ABD1UDI5_9LAMI
METFEESLSRVTATAPPNESVIKFEELEYYDLLSIWSRLNDISYDERHGSEKRMKGSAAFLKISDAGRHNTPCPTIFVVNLGLTCSEEELIPVFSRCRGFLKLKMHSTIGAPLAFVDFQESLLCCNVSRSCFIIKLMHWRAHHFPKGKYSTVFFIAKGKSVNMGKKME